MGKEDEDRYWIPRELHRGYDPLSLPSEIFLACIPQVSVEAAEGEGDA